MLAAQAWGAQRPPAQPSFETVYSLTASRILPPALLAGPHHRVEEAVASDGLMHTYSVRSRYGSYQVVSTALLAIRVDEFAAMALMDRANGAKEYGKGLWEGGVSVARGVKNLVTKPGETLESAASGIGRLFARAGEPSTPSKYEDSPGAQLTGFASSRREYAKLFHVDPYSANEPLQERLRSVAAAGYAGQITSIGLKALIPGGVGIAVSSVGGVDWLNEVDLAQPPSELRLRNCEALASMGVRREALEAFMGNAEFTPTQQSLLVAALARLRGTGGKSAFLALAAKTANQQQALFMQRTAQMYAGYRARVDSLKGFTAVGEVPGAVSGRSRLVLCLPLDHLAWTKDAARLLADAQAAQERHGASRVELWLSGTASPLARRALAARQWTIKERAGGVLLGETF